MPQVFAEMTAGEALDDQLDLRILARRVSHRESPDAICSRNLDVDELAGRKPQLRRVDETKRDAAYRGRQVRDAVDHGLEGFDLITGEELLLGEVQWLTRKSKLYGLILDFDGYIRQGGRVLPVVVRAEQQFQAAGQQDPDVGLSAAAVTAVLSGEPPAVGSSSRRRALALRTPVPASGPKCAHIDLPSLGKTARPLVHPMRPRRERRWQLSWHCPGL